MSEETLQELAIRSRIGEILKPYLPVINGNPELLSLLYNGNMLPEQAVTIREAIQLAVVIEAFYLGQRLPRGIPI
jgi:hypothetical protein